MPKDLLRVITYKRKKKNQHQQANCLNYSDVKDTMVHLFSGILVLQIVFDVYIA